MTEWAIPQMTSLVICGIAHSVNIITGSKLYATLVYIDTDRGQDKMASVKGLTLGRRSSQRLPLREEGGASYLVTVDTLVQIFHKVCSYQ